MVLGVMLALSHNGVLKAADSFPPIVASASGDIWDLRQVMVTFSEEVVGALDPFVYRLEGLFDPANFIAVTNVAYGASNNIVLLRLESPRDLSATYDLHIAFHTIEDAHGNPLADPTIVRVTVPTTFQNGALGFIGTKDTRLEQNAPDTIHGDDATVTCDASPVNQGLLRFDDVFGGGPNQIPYGVGCITKATLRLYTTDQSSPNTPIRMLRMRVPWDEQSTWNSLGSGIDQTNQVETGVTDALIIGSTNQSLVHIDVTAAVQAWSDGAANYGWAFLATGTDGWSWASSHRTNAAWRPALIVSWVHCDPICRIIRHPTSVTVAERDLFTLTVEAFGLGGLRYQWFKDDVPIEGAIYSTYTVFRAVPSDGGNYHVRVYNQNIPEFDCISDVTTVTVCCPPPPFQLVSAIGNPDQTTVTLSFNDYIDLTSALNVSNYTISGGLSIVGATTTGSNVTLTTGAPRDIGRNYVLTVRDVRNFSPPADLMLPNPTTINLTQDVRLLAFDALWRYHNEGRDLGSEWHNVDYDDASWPSGPGLLGFETTDATLIALSNQNALVGTMLSRGNFGTNTTDYFRTLLNVPFDTAGVTFNIRHVVDDGAVFYLNGVEAARFNMPDGEIDHLTLAATPQLEGVVRAITNLTGLRRGLNHVAVEVHQQTTLSGDVLFGAESIAQFTPHLTIVQNPDRTLTISWLPASAMLQQANHLGGDWTIMPGTVSPMRIPALGAARFYRLRLE
jgi:hypothetical protein